jgi:hypothetical protein
MNRQPWSMPRPIWQRPFVLATAIAFTPVSIVYAMASGISMKEIADAMPDLWEVYGAIWRGEF